MAERLMIECDNPSCDSVGHPEHIPGEDGRRRKKGEKVLGPYGWHQGDGWLIGCGPAYHYNACSNPCVGPAIIEQIRLAHEAEDSQYQ